MRDIVCLATTRFDSVPTRKQNVMIRLRDSRILYFNPQITIAAPLKDKSSFKYLFSFLKKGINVQNNVKVYDLPPILPLYNKVRFINKINQFFTAIYVNFRMRQNRFRNTLLWCYSPSSSDIVGHIKYKNLVYDCVDRHSGYIGMIDPFVVDTMDKDLVRKCDIVFSTAIGLHETIIETNENAFMIPNGCAYELFSKAHFEEFKRPIELQGVTGKIFGFIGMLQECIDYDKIELLAKERPSDTIIMIGKPLPGVDLSRFDAYENVIIRGLVKQNELPQYLSHFDVCLNVFNSGMLSKDVSPLKFYEYLATGKPVLCTKEPLQVNDFADCVYIANDDAEFLKFADSALSEPDGTKTELRLKYAKECSWDERVSKMQKILIDNKVF